MQYYIGIDNGLDGGIAVIDRQSKIVRIRPMPTQKLGKGRVIDAAAVLDLLTQWQPPEVTILLEEASKHAAGVLSLCSTWRSFGALDAILRCTRHRYHIIRPQQWQKAFWARPKMAKGQTFNTKAAALAAARRLWPDENWLATERSTTPHDGMVDGALIAEFGRKNRL
ncbi:MAG: hypothetical protein JJU00_14830 [Opitutales bacterium]|nr:hypothetical protein [Opitutales bacterium]